MTRRILKWNVPVDDNRHSIGGGPVVHVASQHTNNLQGYIEAAFRAHGEPRELIQVWTDEEGEPRPEQSRLVQVFGTGQPLPDHAGQPLGTAIAHNGTLVWHVIEMRPDA